MELTLKNTTKFAYCSDLHLDFGSLVIDNTENADCLILAGDIIEFSQLVLKSDLSYNYVDEFFKNISDQFKQVIWIPGNHEYYGTSIWQGPMIANRYIEANGFGNIKVVNNDVVYVNDVPVVCSTLWTDLGNANPIVMEMAGRSMNDYRHIDIKRGDINVALRPIDTYNMHMEALQFLDSAITDVPCVVVSHHAPSFACSDYPPSMLDHAYMSNMCDFILDRPSINYWIYGHTHSRIKFELGEAKVMSNCRGYAKYEKMAKTFELKYFDV